MSELSPISPHTLLNKKYLGSALSHSRPRTGFWLLIKMSTAPNQSSPLTQPPHIRLNSGTGDALKQGSVRNRPPPLGNPDSNSVRSLIPQSQAPVTPGTPGFYLAGSQPSAERLLPPSSRSRTHRFRDDDATGSPDPFADSRRTSWSSEGGSTHSRIYSPGPYEDSRAPSRAGSDDENLNTQTVSEKYNILPSAGLLLFPEDVETDDYLHNPDPNDKDTRDCDIFNKRGLVNMGGLVFILGGLLAIFIAFPVLYALLHLFSACRLTDSAAILCKSSTLMITLARTIRIAYQESQTSLSSRTCGLV